VLLKRFRPARPDHPNVWPNLFIVGAPKAGTTSLWEYLRHHPQVHMSAVKEPYFFDLPDPAQPGAIKDPKRYIRLFARGRDKAVRGEATPSYLSDPRAPEAIKELVPDARIVIVLRDPVARTYSAYLQQLRFDEDRPLLEVVRAEAATGFAKHGLPSPILGRSFYAKPVERYLTLFDGNVAVLFYEELAADARGELRKVLEFVGVDPTFAETASMDVQNPFSVPRNAVFRRLFRSPRARRAGRALVPLVHRASVSTALVKPAPKPEMDAAARNALVDLFEPERERLRELLGRPVTW
jgi:hypothetical protein